MSFITAQTYSTAHGGQTLQAAKATCNEKTVRVSLLVVNVFNKNERATREGGMQ